MKDSYKKMSYEELVTAHDNLCKEYMDLRMEKVLSHIDNPLSLRTKKKDIARLNTLIHEYALGIRKAN